MNKVISRQEAITALAKAGVDRLTIDERQNLLMDWWPIDFEDAEFAGLPQELKQEITLQDEPGDVMNPIYAPLLAVILRRSFCGVVNSYLQTRLLTVGYDVTVVGEVEKLEVCPCCNYRTLRARGSYEICPVCFWEDDGTASMKLAIVTT